MTNKAEGVTREAPPSETSTEVRRGPSGSRRPIADPTTFAFGRRLAAGLGLGGILLIALIGDRGRVDVAANATLAALAVAVAFGWTELVSQARRAQPVARIRTSAPRPQSLWPVVLVAIACGLAVQLWFHAGAAVAGGDTTPPNGLAWISRMFTDWTWSGSDMGGPSALEEQLPWAAMLVSIHAVGGSPELAQRLWYTILFSGASAACALLLVGLGIRPAPAAVGALAYAFSPWVLANAVPNPVFLATMAVLPALPAIVLAAARRGIGFRLAVVLIAASAPMLGYVYQNPPMLGLVLLAIVLSPVAAGWLFGRTAAARALAVVAVGVPAAVAVSAYWIVPAFNQLAGSTHIDFAPIASWIWTEGRATIANALWLNTFWGWPHPEYFPFAAAYSSPPLSLMRFIPAALAFSALMVSWSPSPDGRRALTARATVLAATIALGLIFLSTGTNPPGSSAFDVLYALPLGWLLREPGRFLVAADLMYAVLIAIAIDRIMDTLPGWARVALDKSHVGKAGIPLVASALILIPGLPLATGSALPDKRPILPSFHVSMPAYWTDMAAYINRPGRQGAVLVMPPDDFYQMPYRWGYYGTDDFITNLMSRPVLLPTAQAYFPPSPQLLGVVDLTTNAIVANDWPLAGSLMQALGASSVLVRRDLSPSFPGRTIQSPTGVAAALSVAPNFTLARASGPLLLYDLTQQPASGPEVAPYFATVDTRTPDLRVLSRLPDSARLVTGPRQPGVPFVLQAPPAWAWSSGQDRLSWNFTETPGWSYDLARLDVPGAPQPITALADAQTPVGGIEVTRGNSDASGQLIQVTLGDQAILPNGNFKLGVWGPVGDCANFYGSAAKPYLHASVVAHGGPAGGAFLRLSAQVDSACEAQILQWVGGSVVIKMNVRHDAGEAPRICLWEEGVNRCAALPPIPGSGAAWAAYRGAAAIDPGTTAVQLFLYSDVFTPHTLTQNDYADIQVLDVAELPQVDVIGTPAGGATSQQLLTLNAGYSPAWTGPAGSTHVLVNGLVNGWLVSKGQRGFVPRYGNGSNHAAFIVSLLAVAAVVGLALSIYRHAMARVEGRVLRRFRNTA